MIILNVAEKNSVAKELVNIFSRGLQINKLPNPSKYNPITEIQNFTLPGCPLNGKMIITSVSGHLMGLDFTRESKHWHSCPPSALFDAPLEESVPEDKSDLRRQLQDMARRATHLVLWLDCDREGEAIGFEVMRCCQQVNKRIVVKRAWFSALTANALHTAMRSLREPDKNVSDAVEARTEIDLRLGAAFTRLQTMRLQKKFPQFSTGRGVVSYGPCQIPTLGFIVQRYWENKMFQAEAFWFLKCSTERDGERANFTWARGRLFDRFSCVVFFDICMDNPTAKVVEVKHKPKSKWRPQPLATIELQKLASRYLHFASERTMQVAEKLYQQGLLSYPRTETNRFSAEYDLPALVGLQTADHRWGGFATNLLQGQLNPRNGTDDDKAHPPIHPVKAASNLAGDEERIYELVTRHFLACVAEDARGAGTEVRVDVNGEEFNTSGLMVIERNYLEVYRYQSWNANSIPVFQPGEEFEMSEFMMTEGTTTAPPLLSEEDLISKMDDNGIGTDATIHDHIKTVQEREYATRQHDRRFKPTEIGIGLVDSYQAMGHKDLSEPALRAKMEKGMLHICQGSRSKVEVMAQVMSEMRVVFKDVEAQMEAMEVVMAQYFPAAGQGMNVEVVQDMFSECGLCHTKMSLKRDPPILFLECSVCQHTLPLPSSKGAESKFETKASKCSLCDFQLLLFKRNGALVNETCPWCYNHPPAPQCGKLMELKTYRSDFYVGCETYPNCLEILKLPRTIIKSATVSEVPCGGACPRESSKLTIQLKKGSMPPGCPVCDPYIAELCELPTGTCKGPAQNPAPNQQRGNAAPPNQQRGNAAPPNQQRGNAAAQVREDGAGRNRSVCPRCGQHGHAQDNCPANRAPNMSGTGGGGAGGGGTGGGNNCFHCHQPGHFSGNCPSKQAPQEPSRNTGGGGGGDCFHCHQPGHYASNCPNKQGGGSIRQGGGNSNSRPQQHQQHQAGSSGGPVCTACSKAKVQMTVRKEGPNQGRLFWTCPERCDKQFEWADTNAPNTSNVASRAFTAPPSCFNCGEPGHNQNQCPIQGNASGNKRSIGDQASASVAKKLRNCKICGVSGPHPKDSKCGSLKRNKGN